jgi:predicted acylesterase/phospholipase RssA
MNISNNDKINKIININENINNSESPKNDKNVSILDAPSISDIPTILDASAIKKEIKKPNEKKSNLKDTLVLSGGGIHGIAHLGTIQILFEKDILKNINTFCGTSAGAIISTLLVLGYTPKELFTLSCELDFTKLTEFKIENFSKKSGFGFDDGLRLIYVIKRLLSAKGFDENITLKQLYEKTNKKLIITASCANTAKVCYLSHENDPDILVTKAVRMSIGVPGYFTAINHLKYLYFDGGCDNYPIHLFKDNIENVIGIHIVSHVPILENIDNIEDYLFRVIQCYKKTTEFHSQRGYEKYTISLTINNSDEFDFMNFHLDTSKKTKLYKLGYDAGFEYFENNNLT